MTGPAGHKHHSAIRNPQPKAFQHDLFARLNWPLWKPLSNAKLFADESVLAGNAKKPLQWQPLFDDSLQLVHTISSLPGTNPPLSHMADEIATIHDHDEWQDSCLMDQRPATLVMDNSCGQQGEINNPITIAQSVSGVVAYFGMQPLRMAVGEIFSAQLGQAADRAFSRGSTGPTQAQPDHNEWNWQRQSGALQAPIQLRAERGHDE